MKEFILGYMGLAIDWAGAWDDVLKVAMLVIDQVPVVVDLSIEDLRVDEPLTRAKDLWRPILQGQSKEAYWTRLLTIHSPRNQRVTPDVSMNDRIYMLVEDDISTTIFESNLYSSSQLYFEVYFYLKLTL